MDQKEYKFIKLLLKETPEMAKKSEDVRSLCRSVLRQLKEWLEEAALDNPLTKSIPLTESTPLTEIQALQDRERELQRGDLIANIQEVLEQIDTTESEQKHG